jgi:hypothetical protein
MIQSIIIQILPQVLFTIITTIFSFLTILAKNLYNSHKAYLDLQRQQLIQKIGIDKYNQDIVISQYIIHSVEEQARQFNWDSTIKHAKATELISGATGLTAEQIFNTIKATVDLFNQNKKAVSANTTTVAQAQPIPIQHN